MRLNKKCLSDLAFALLLPLTAQAGEWIEDPKGCKAWNASPAPGESITWSGACEDGYATGHGKQNWFLNGKPGSKYEGQMRSGKMSGKGTYTWKNGQRYEGDWVEGKKTGKGSMIWPESNRNCSDEFCIKQYVGEWKDGNKTCGKTDFWDGDSYDGCYEKDGYTMTGKTKFKLAKERAALVRRSKCEHLYVGKAVKVLSNNGWMDLDAVILGFSSKAGKASIKFTNHDSHYGTKEIDCEIIKE